MLNLEKPCDHTTYTPLHAKLYQPHQISPHHIPSTTTDTPPDFPLDTKSDPQPSHPHNLYQSYEHLKPHWVFHLIPHLTTYLIPHLIPRLPLHLITHLIQRLIFNLKYLYTICINHLNTFFNTL